VQAHQEVQVVEVLIQMTLSVSAMLEQQDKALQVEMAHFRLTVMRVAAAAVEQAQLEEHLAGQLQVLAVPEQIGSL
jgi:hypothetical protein